MPPAPISIFDTIKIPIIIYILLVFISIMILLAFGLYLIWIYHTGKSMSPFFWGRINSWFNKTRSLLQIITLNDNVIIEEAIYNYNKGYERVIPTKQIKQKEQLNKSKLIVSIIITTLLIISIYLLSTYFNLFTDHPILSSLPFMIVSLIPLLTYYNRPSTTKTIQLTTDRKQTPIIPTSSYSLNGVDTVLLWDIHPPLPEYIKKGLDTLINLNTPITTFEELNILANDKPNDILFDKITNIEFLKMYLAYRNKYEVKISTSTVSNFITKNFDENYSESLQIKDFNSSFKSKTDDRYTKWAHIALIIFVIGITFKLIWTTVY